MDWSYRQNNDDGGMPKMTVRELIEQLQLYDEDDVVLLCIHRGDPMNVPTMPVAVSTVEIKKPDDKYTVLFYAGDAV